SMVRTAAPAISACSTRSNKAALVTAGGRQYFLKTGFSFVVSHTSGMMVRHGDADSFFESSRVAARDRIPLIPFDDFPSFVEDFHGSIRILRQRFVFALRHCRHGESTFVVRAF